MSDISNLNESNSNNELSVILSHQRFAEMILNFLGKKEKLAYEIDKASFFIRLNDLEQFYYLLEAKTSKEQGVYLDHFLVTLSYNDGTKREINGIDSLNKFNETRDVTPIDVTMTWNIIIKYPNAETIENQKIEVTFIKDSNKKDNNKIILVIHHTNQAWGIEVLNLFKDKIKELTVSQSKKYKTSKKIFSILDSGSTFAPLMLAVFMLISAFSKDKEDSLYYYNLLPYYINKQEFIETDISLYSIQHLNSDFLRKTANEVIKSPKLKEVLIGVAEIKDSTKWMVLKKFLLNLFSVICPFLIMFSYFKKACSFYFMPSFIVINKRSESEYNEYKTGKNNTEFYSITFICFSIVTGIIVNYLYQVIATY
jgi:hypothetical protein